MLSGDLSALSAMSIGVALVARPTKIFDLYHAPIFQVQAGDRGTLVIGHKRAIFFRDSQSVDIETSFGGNALVEVARAALDICRRFFGQFRNAFACFGQDERCTGMVGDVWKIPRGLICRLMGLDAISTATA